MKTGTKVGIGIGAVAAIVGGYFLWKKVIKPKREAKKDSETKPLSEVNTNITKAPTSSRGSSSSSSSSSVTVPFTNKEEGNHFRNWINDNHSAYAKKIDLDRDGSYNNAYIKKAWKEYGEAYQKAIKDAKAAADKKAAQIKVGDWTMTNSSHLNSKKQQTYSRPTMVSADYRGKVTGIPKNVKFKVRKLGTDITNGKKMCYIFNEGWKVNSNYTKGTGFKVYCSYLKKVSFYEDFDGLDTYGY